MGPRPGPVKIRSARRIGNWEKPSRTWLLSWRSGWRGRRSPSGSTSPFWQGLVTGASICDLRVILGIKGHRNQCWAPSSLKLKGFRMLHHSYTSQRMLPTLTRSRPAHRTIWLFTLTIYGPDRVPGTRGWRQSQVLADNFWYSLSLLLFPLKKTLKYNLNNWETLVQIFYTHTVVSRRHLQAVGNLVSNSRAPDSTFTIIYSITCSRFIEFPGVLGIIDTKSVYWEAALFFTDKYPLK